MKQITFNQYGPPSHVAQCVTVSDPTPPSTWEVVVDVEAFPINYADLAMLAGSYGTLVKPPSPIGMEAIGRVSAKGEAVVHLSVGDRVIILANNNWGEKRKVPAAAVHKVSSLAPVDQLAMLKVNLATAYLMIQSVTAAGHLDCLIQNAPLSSVGRAVLQIAKDLNIRTINLVRRPESIPEVLAFGADIAIQDTEKVSEQLRSVAGHAPILAAFDAVGGDAVQRLAMCLSEGGQIINYGMLSNQPIQISPEQTIFRSISLKGFWLSKTLNRLSLQQRTELFDHLASLVTAGKLATQIDSYYPLERISAAIARAEQSARNGKVLVVTKHAQDLLARVAD